MTSRERAIKAFMTADYDPFYTVLSIRSLNKVKRTWVLFKHLCIIFLNKLNKGII